MSAMQWFFRTAGEDIAVERNHVWRKDYVHLVEEELPFSLDEVIQYLKTTPDTVIQIGYYDELKIYLIYKDGNILVLIGYSFITSQVFSITCDELPNVLFFTDFGDFHWKDCHSLCESRNLTPMICTYNMAMQLLKLFCSAHPQFIPKHVQESHLLSRFTLTVPYSHSGLAKLFRRLHKRTAYLKKVIPRTVDCIEYLLWFRNLTQRIVKRLY